MGLRGYDQWNKKGIYIDYLNDYIYPFYSVFVPTQKEYLNLLINKISNDQNVNKLYGYYDQNTKDEDFSILDIGMTEERVIC